MNITADVPLKLKRAVSADDLSEAVREYTIPSRQTADGVSVPVSPVVIVDPSSDPHRLVPQGWWLYQAQRINTQTNGAGGALTTRVWFPPGQVARLVAWESIGAASVALLTVIAIDEDGVQTANMASVAPGASNLVSLPSTGSSSGATVNIVNSLGMYFGPGQGIRTSTSAALLNQTLTVRLVLLLSTPVIPTWDTTGSAGTPVLADSTISEANTLQKVDLPW